MDWLEDRTLLSGGGLDPSFGSGGIAVTDIRGGTDQANDLALQQDGKIVTVGTTSGNSNDFAIVRYNSNGTLDSTFNSSGIVTVDFGGDDRAMGVALQSTGKILVAGSTSIGSNFALVRLNANGSFDTTFGQGGLITTDMGGTDAANSMVIQSNDDIILAGVSNNEFALARYLPDGTLDTTFGNGGKVITDISGTGLPNTINDVILQPDGEIVVGGNVNGNFVVARYNPNGQLDSNFGTNGKVITNFPNRTSIIHDLALQTNGEIVAAGESFDASTGKNEFALARYTTAGAPDTGFGNNGVVLSNFSTVDIAGGVVIQSNGKLDVAGSSTPGTFRIARYNSDGSLDLGFGTNGSVTVPNGQASAILLQPDAKFVVAGTTGTDFEVARYFVGNPFGDLEFSQPTFTGAETSGKATITVERVNGSQGTVTVNYATSDGSAQAGVQYQAASGTLTFGPNETTKTFNITLLQDGIIDGTTTVNLNLSSPTGGATLGDQPAAVLDITDAPGSLQFSNMTYTVNASAGSALITVTRAVGDGGAVTVDFATSDGSAVGGVDYVPAAGTLFFADGQLTSSFVISLLNDPNASGTLTVNLALSNPTNGATLGTPVAAELDIHISPGEFDFAAATFTGQEGNGLATITVDRLGGSDGAASIDFATSDGTGKAGVIYQPVSGTLDFASGVTSQSFTVPILLDGMNEGNLSVNLTLSNPQGGATLGGRKNAVLIIIDSPGQLQFGASAFGTQESAGTVLLTVTRSAGVGGLVSVNYATKDGTALAGTDYTGTTGTLVFGPGEVGKLISIPILDDGVVGGITKTFTVTLTGAGGGASLGSASSATVKILDDHQPKPDDNFNGSGKTNVAVFRPPTGQWFVAGFGLINLGQQGDVTVPGYYEGKDTFDSSGNLVPGIHKTEAAVYRPSTGTWYIDEQNGVRAIQFGEPNVDIPVPADYDGDGQTDLAVYRPTTGQWFILRSTTGPQVRTFGAPNLDQPVPGDYDGDGRADLAVYRPSTGQWLIDGSKVGSITRQFGIPNVDKPIPADFDGDGKTDLALYRPSTAQWIILLSSGGSKVVQFGQPNVDEPIPADYDGDGKADLAVFRPTTATWYILESTLGPKAFQIGEAGVDTPASPPISYRATGSVGFFDSGTRGLAGSFAGPGAGGASAAAGRNAASSAADEQAARLALASTPATANSLVYDSALDSVSSSLGDPFDRFGVSLGRSSRRLY